MQKRPDVYLEIALQALRRVPKFLGRFMKRISSKRTIFYKRLFPVLWFGFLAFFVLADLLASRRTHVRVVPMFIVPVMMAVFGYVLFRVYTQGITLGVAAA
jgi:uncharacterized RDD family membrane protein YckC